MSTIAIGTRFHDTDPMKGRKRIEPFLEAALLIGIPMIAVNIEEDKTDVLKRYPGTAFPVTPWGSVVQPLNALVLRAAAAGAEHILFASVRFPPKKEHVDTLMSHMDENTLVVGAVFQDHNYFPGGNVIPCKALASPWNTHALWNLKHLKIMGFPLMADSPLDPKNYGMEEVSAISLAQRCFLHLQAKLVYVDGLSDKTCDGDQSQWTPEKLDRHNKKMASKASRSATQMKAHSIQPGIVYHI